MILLILFMTAQFCTAQIHPEQQTIPIVSDEHGILSFGDPFEQNETTQFEEQSPTDESQPMDELPLSADFYQEADVEVSPLHASQPRALRTPLTKQDIESLSTGLFQPTYIYICRAHQQEVPPTLPQETVVMETNIEPVDTDLGTLLAYGNLGPLSVDDINIEPFDSDMETSLNDTYQFDKALVVDLRNQTTFSDSLRKKNDEKRERNVACPTLGRSACGQPFGSVRSIYNQSVVQSVNSKYSTINRTAQNPFQCDMCPKQFHKLSEYQRHRRTHTGEKPFKCDFCNKEFADRSNYYAHRRIHTDEKPFQCDICEEQFRTSSHYWRHRQAHTDEKPFQCDNCSKQFRSSNAYQTHRRIHTGEKPFKCDDCHKEFSDRSSYQTHRRKHTGEKPFQCDVCAKQFRTSSHYQTHRRIHTGEKPFKCDVCQKQFTSFINYQTHRRIHTGEKPFQCDICAEKFSTLNNCQRHRRTHTGEKPFQCDKCSKGFRSPSDCRRHRRTHTGEKPFRCEICLKRFRTSDEYKIHRRKQSPIFVSDAISPTPRSVT